MSDDRKLTTEELLKLLYMESSLDRLMNKGSTSFSFPSFPAYITALCRQRQEAPERIIKRANIEKSYGHQIFSGRRNPSRDTVLQLAFGFDMDYEQTQELLKIARKSPLHPRVKRDMVIVFCLQHRYSIVECQIYLEEYGLPLLGEGGRYDG